MNMIEKLKGCQSCAERRARMKKIWENNHARKRIEKAVDKTRRTGGDATAAGSSNNESERNSAVSSGRTKPQWGRNGKRL